MRSRGQKLHKGLVDTYGGMIKNIEVRINAGEKVPDCLAKTMLEMRRSEDLGDLDMGILASAFMIGGVETTASIMQWFSALIPAYPEIQKKAQAEIDSVIGTDRLPSLSDRGSLPYTEAIVNELLRWQPVTPLGPSSLA